MANKMTSKEYNEVKNAGYTVISFYEGRRTMTYGNASLTQAMQEVMFRGRLGHNCLVINLAQAEELGVKIPMAVWDEKGYAHLKEIKWLVM